MKKNCIVCGAEVNRSPSSYAKSGKVFCSHKCSELHSLKNRSKITNCIICSAELKPGEGWATPLKKRKDYLCSTCKINKISVDYGKTKFKIKQNRKHLNLLKNRLELWKTKQSFQKKCKWCGGDISYKDIGKSFFCNDGCWLSFEKADPKLLLSKRMRKRMNDCVIGGKSGESWQKLVGYTVDDLKRHIEKLFLPGMTWENIGGWHIDHILPVSRFNYNSPLDPDFKRCWGLKNLRPMWAKDNIRKSNKVEKPMQPSLSWFDTM